MASSMTSGASGSVLQEIVNILHLGMPSVAGGHVHVVAGEKKAMAMPRIKSSGNIVQAYTADPSDSGTLAYTENSVTIAKAQVYTTFLPEQFEDAWRPFQPTGPFLYQSLPVEVQVALAEEILSEAADWLEFNLWQGSTVAAAPNNIFDGIFRKAAADALVADVSTPVALTAVNIVGELGRLYAAIPNEVKFGPRRPKIFLSYADWQHYGNALKALANKGLEFMDEAATMFNGLDVVALPGVPKDKMLAAIGNNTPSSDLHLVMPSLNDIMEFRVDRTALKNETYFFKMIFKAGVVFRYGEQITAYNA